MAKKLTYEEKFERFKKKIRDSATQSFFGMYQEMKEIEEGLVEEKKTAFNDKAKEGKDV